jgi:Cu(I)/Ag(I) efflux system membrane protein CusA/SilA
MVVYLHESLDRRLATGVPLKQEDIEAAAIEGAVQRLRPKLMTVFAVLASLIPILRETGIGSDVMKPIAAPIVGGMTTSTIHVLILVPVFFALMKERALRRGTLRYVGEHREFSSIYHDIPTESEFSKSGNSNAFSNTVRWQNPPRRRP